MLSDTSHVAAQVFGPGQKISFFTWLTISSAALLCILRASGYTSKESTLVYSFLWRLAYNAGLGWMLHKQSSCNWIVDKAKKLGLGKLEKGQKRNWLARFLVRQIEGSVNTGSKAYDYESKPVEYNVWILVRHLVDLILVNDFFSYIVFALSYFEFPENGIATFDIFRYIAGTLLLIINLWVKTDAHRVLRDYAWYWGDFFFRVEKDLTFNGVFELAPHPMYSIGYVGLYGASLITRSYYVLFASIVFHISQLLFLTLVETPHMDKVYGPEIREINTNAEKVVNKYFSKGDKNIWKLNLHSEISLLCCFLYLQTIILSSSIARPASEDSFRALLVLVGQAAFWLTLRTFGIGYILYKQSKSSSWVNYFAKKGRSDVEAFRYWRILYDVIHNQSYITLFICCWKLMDFGQLHSSKTFISRIVIGITLCLLQIWSTKSALHEIRISGWYYGDFFNENLRLSEEPAYTGIYRYVDNPLAYLTSLWGVSLIVNSSFVYFLVAYVQIGLWLITQYVERPHLRKIYGSRLRNIPGAQRVIFNEITKVQINSRKKTLETVASALEATSPKLLKASFGLRSSKRNAQKHR